MNVVLIAHPRSGSNSIVEILQEHPSIGLIENEPFAEGYATWDPDHSDYYERLRSGEDFDTLLDEIFLRSSGLKELSYQLEGDLLSHLVHRADVQVMTLRRRNVLMTALSQVLAEQTDLWKTWDATRPLEDYYADLEALDVALIRERMEWTTAEVQRVAQVTEDVEVLELVYEEVFTGEVAEGLRATRRLWEFLGLAPVDSPQIRHYLSPAVQQGGVSTYGRVPNLDAIEAALGSNETGHIQL